MNAVPCIYIVDDEQADVALTAEVLKNAGMSVTCIGDGFKAIAACKVRTPDVILLDLHMPFMSGLDVLNRLVKEERTKHVPVVLLCSSDESHSNLVKEHGDCQLLMKPLDPEDVLLLIRALVKEKLLKDELEKKESQVRDLILTDSLTSCSNLRYLSEFLKTEIGQCRRYKQDLSLLIIAIDNCQELLGAYGSESMDLLLVQISEMLARDKRSADLLARTGTYEFALALPFTNVQGAVEIAERIRSNVARSTFAFGDKVYGVTASVGIAQLPQDKELTGEMLLDYARTAMSHAKNAGGNQIFMAE